MSQKLSAVYSAASVQDAAIRAGIDSARQLALFHLVLSGIKHLHVITLAGGNWADAFRQEDPMSLRDIEDSPFAIVIARMVGLNIAFNMLKKMDVTSAIGFGFYAEHESEAPYIMELWKEAISISRTPARPGSPLLARVPEVVPA